MGSLTIILTKGQLDIIKEVAAQFDIPVEKLINTYMRVTSANFQQNIRDIAKDCLEELKKGK